MLSSLKFLFMQEQTTIILFLWEIGYGYIHSKKYILDFPLEQRNTILRNKYDFLILLAVHVLYLCNRDASVSLGALISNICDMVTFQFSLFPYLFGEIILMGTYQCRVGFWGLPLLATCHKASTYVKII